MKKLRAAGTVAALGMLGWAAYSYLEMNKPLPSDEELEAYAESLFNQAGLGEYMNTWREEVLRANGRELHIYFFDAAPEDPALVFVPGTGVYALLYTEFMHRLSEEGFNVIGLDPRGHGKSSGKRGSYTLGGLVEDARAVIDHAFELYGDRVAVAGSSQGGMTAFYAAAAEPRLKAAICHNVIAPDEPDNYRMTRWPALYSKMMPVAPLATLVNIELRLPVWAYLDLKHEETRMVPDVGRFFEEDPMAVSAVSLSAFASLAFTPITRPVEEIDVPVMVIHSELDDIFPEDYVRRVYGRLKCEKEFLYLQGKYHLVMFDFVDEILPPITEFLKRQMSE